MLPHGTLDTRFIQIIIHLVKICFYIVPVVEREWSPSYVVGNMALYCALFDVTKKFLHLSMFRNIRCESVKMIDVTKKSDVISNVS
jgi:hypothetical protein